MNMESRTKEILGVNLGTTTDEENMCNGVHLEFVLKSSH